MVKLFSVKCSNKRICCVSNNPTAVNPFLTIQTKTYVSVFCRLSQNIILECAVFKLLLFIQNIHSYIISKCKSVKVINSPWFLAPHFYLLSVQSYKRLKLRTFKEWLFRKTNGRQILVVKINIFANVLMFILRELKDILVYLLKNWLYEQHRNHYSIPHNIFAIAAWKKCILCN